MKAVNFIEFRINLKKYLDDVENNIETLIVRRRYGHGTVLISLDEFNSLKETIHLFCSKANADRLYESILQMNTRISFSKDLIEE